MFLFYLFAIIFVVSWSFVNGGSALQYNLNRNNKLAFVSVVFLVLLAALRNSSVGPDTIFYISDYENLQGSGLKDTFKYGESYGYYVASYIFYHLTHLSVHWWFGVCEAFYCFALWKFFKYYETDKLYGFIIYFGIGLFSFSLAGQKQTMSMAFSLLAWIAFMDKKYFRLVVMSFLMFICHTSSLIMIFAIVFYYIRNIRFYYLIIVLISIVFIVAGHLLWNEGVLALESEHYSMYQTQDNVLNSSIFIFELVLFITAIPFIKNFELNDMKNSRIIVGASAMVPTLTSLSTSFSTAFRLGYFFIPFLIVLLTNCTNNYDENKKNKIYQYIVIFMVLFFFFYSGRDNEYKFFWS